MKYSAIALTMTSLLALSACDSAPQSAAPASAEQGATMTIEQAVNHSDRTPAFVQRDAFRHPAETLAFFELEPSMTVVEIWPGGGYYSEILAPYLAEEGTFMRLTSLKRATATTISVHSASLKNALPAKRSLVMCN